jgi:hypothetical protein
MRIGCLWPHFGQVTLPVIMPQGKGARHLYLSFFNLHHDSPPLREGGQTGPEADISDR